jgi:hypothetical protein
MKSWRSAPTKLLIFGIVTNGRIWEFVKLQNSEFVTHPDSYSIGNLDRLFAAINFMFQQCKIQLEAEGDARL